jgi:tetratricopeptide (TPR) repeat protein
MTLIRRETLLHGLVALTLVACSAGDEPGLTSSQQALRGTASAAKRVHTVRLTKQPLKTASVTPQLKMTADQEAGQIFGLLLGSTEAPGLVTHVQAKLSQLAWADAHIGIATAAADLAQAQGNTAQAFDLYLFALDRVVAVDPNQTTFPGHAAYVVSRIDEALVTTEERHGDVHAGRLQVWQNAAATLDATGAPSDTSEVAYGNLASDMMVSRDLVFGARAELRTWMPQSIRGFIAREAGDLDASKALLEASLAGAIAQGIRTAAIEVELAETLALQGDAEGAAQHAAEALNSTFSAVAESANPSEASAHMSVVRRANLASVDTTREMLAEAIADHAPTSSLGMVARLYAVALNHFVEGGITAYADPSNDAEWSALETYAAAYPVELNIAMEVYMNTLGSQEGAQTARNLMYVALYHKAAFELIALNALGNGDETEAATLVPELVDSLETMLSTFTAEADDHEQSRPSAVVNLVTSAKSAAGRFDLDTAFQAGVLAAWSL